MLCPGLSMYRLRKGLRNRTWERLDLHFPLTAFLRPGANVVLIETEGSRGVLPLEAAWAQSPSFRGLWPRPALHFTQLPAHALGLRGDPGKCLPGRVTKGSVMWERVLLSEMAFCFSWMSVISITQAMHSLEGVWLISLYKELSDTLLIYHSNCTAYYL